MKKDLLPDSLIKNNDNLQNIEEHKITKSKFHDKINSQNLSSNKEIISSYNNSYLNLSEESLNILNSNYFLLNIIFYKYIKINNLIYI